MKLRALAGALIVCLVALSEGARSQSAPPAAIVGGSRDTFVGGKAAARAGDAAAGGEIIEGSPNVFINGKPAALAGAKTGCGAHVATGAANVFVNGKPLARTGDALSGCPK